MADSVWFTGQNQILECFSPPLGFILHDDMTSVMDWRVVLFHSKFSDNGDDQDSLLVL